MITNLKTGDYVYDQCDPRHVGRIVAIFNHVVRVRWITNPWTTDLHISNVRKEHGPM
jgi:hypothetical protein